eukprot:CAMPEP_0198145342 /NCGR_PEP_ID=MMETSP1443-20131203/22814_1 /TAXON_ID=186043 /ORGANISM="Entomoneis sp., Strain CCMP2396" /LENGTH=136 /DNA_ID=CAMNT_0043808957 /DNA_START=106 /DNA_END=516 /DNA_ORIENTATION=+
MKLTGSFVLMLVSSIAAMMSTICVDAFVPIATSTTSSLGAATKSTTACSMGLFDFFGDEAKQAREARKNREVEEQERLQKAILERRRNPEMMEEYEAKVQQRRNLRMQGKDTDAEGVDLYENANDQTLLDGTQGTK